MTEQSFGNLDKSDPNTDGYGCDDDVPLGKTTAGEHLNTAYHDGPEHHDGTSPKNGIRQTGKNTPTGEINLPGSYRPLRS
jgi:hypothetical protein